MLLLACVPLVLAQGTYTQIDYPGASQTFCWGINTAGDISGSYADAGGNYHGFVLSGGAYTTIDYPGAQSTIVEGINDLHQLVGESSFGGFLYDTQTQTFTQINYPGANSSNAIAISNAGVVGGYFASGSGDIQGFALVDGKYILISPPGTISTSVSGITAAGKFVGFANLQSCNCGVSFSYYRGKYKRIVIPNALATVVGVNNSGTALVGDHGTSVGAGFVYQSKVLRSLSFPGSSGTDAIGVNDAGEVVGWFYDANSFAHGYLWTPPADARRK